MSERTGSIKVSTENIFPVIRQWLYTDKDIYIREIVSNAADAITKLEHLRGMNEFESDKPEYRIDIEYDSELGQITVEDNGIGMTEDEIDEYINQIAYSGAMAFVEQYKDKGDANGGVIGHFGLGFYSSFMVSDKVRIDSLSWKDGAKPAFWVSEDGTSYTMGEGTKETRGTKITMTLNEESKAEITGYELRQALNKYCQFMPYPIYFRDVVQEQENLKRRQEQQAKDLEEKAKEREEKAKEREEKIAKGEDVSELEPLEDEDTEPDVLTIPEPTQLNDTNPLWLRDPKDITDDEYKSFYHKVFNDYREPLFWIHLNMDYPFRLKGILYFPQAEEHIDTLAGRIKVYYNQVFVSDDVKEIIPDYLFLLRGCIDSPDLPLNVSRSALQTDSQLKKLSSHIVRKVADKLVALAKDERETFEGYWDDISLFVRYGSLRDEKFFERVKPALLFKRYEGGYSSYDELKEKGVDKVYYTTDSDAQVVYNKRLSAAGKDIVVMPNEFDIPFMQLLQSKEEKPAFVRVDSEVEGDGGNTDRQEQLEKLMRKATGQEKLKVQVKALGPDGDLSILTEDEQARSMLDMRKMFQKMEGKSEEELDEMFPVERTLVINTDSSLITRLCLLDETSGKEDEATTLAAEIYDLARLAHGSLQGEDLVTFMKRSQEILGKIEL